MRHGCHALHVGDERRRSRDLDARARSCSSSLRGVRDGSNLNEDAADEQREQLPPALVESRRSAGTAAERSSAWILLLCVGPVFPSHFSIEMFHCSFPFFLIHSQDPVPALALKSKLPNSPFRFVSLSRVEDYIWLVQLVLDPAPLHAALHSGPRIALARSTADRSHPHSLLAREPKPAGLSYQRAKPSCVLCSFR